MQKICSLCNHINTVDVDKLDKESMLRYHRAYADCEVCGTGYTVRESEVTNVESND